MALSDTLESFYNLRRDRSSGYEKPYKPALLLSLIDLIERDEIRTNRFCLSPDLIKRFKEYIKIVGGPKEKASIAYPFWHLVGDEFWAVYGYGVSPSIEVFYLFFRL